MYSRGGALMARQGAAILAPAGLTLTAWEKDFFREADPWAFILFARNVESPKQLKALTASLRESVGRDALVMIDQEGGRVQRMRAPHWREFMPPLDQADRTNDSETFYRRARLIAHELHQVGIDANCGPCCDIAGPETHPFLQNRCLGRDTPTVVANARATADGYVAGGVLPIMKHMPGHGRTKVDSHLDLPVADIPLAEARDWDFVPFRALADLPMGMTAHMVFPQAGPLPATQNETLLSLIRNDIGFDGLLMTDDISMEALSGTVAERTLASLNAGCDAVLHCNGKADEMEAVAAAAGLFTAESQNRADAAMRLRKTPDDVDIQALEAEFAASFA